MFDKKGRKKLISRMQETMNWRAKRYVQATKSADR